MSNLIEESLTDETMDTIGSGIGVEPVKEMVLLVQHDWNKVSPEKDETFFVGYREPGHKTKFFDVQLDKKSFEFKNDRFKCKKVSNRVLTAELDEPSARRKFVAPYAEYDHLHQTSISSIDVSCTGDLVVSTDSSNGLLVWNSENGSILKNLRGHIMDINCCRFFASGQVVLSGGMDMSLRIWSVETGECPRVLKGHKASILDLAFIGRGREILSAARDGSVRKWDCGLGECTAILDLPNGSPNCIALDSDQTSLVVGSDDGNLYVYDINSKEIVSFSCLFITTSIFHVSTLFLNIVCTSLALHDKYAFVGGDDGTIYVVDLRLMSILQRIKVDRGHVYKLSTAFNGLLASFADGTICFYDNPINSAQSKVEFTGSDCDAIYDFAHTSQYLFSACRDKIVRKYSLQELH